MCASASASASASESASASASASPGSGAAAANVFDLFWSAERGASDERLSELLRNAFRSGKAHLKWRNREVTAPLLLDLVRTRDVWCLFPGQSTVSRKLALVVSIHNAVILEISLRSTSNFDALR